MNIMKAVIVDDEPDSGSLLALQLQDHFPEIRVSAVYTSSRTAADELPLVRPDLVFLDIEMPELNGFELLEKLAPVTFKVIFVTAYNQYAIKAFKFNALDYLVKPVSVDDLRQAIQKIESSSVPVWQQLDALKQQLRGEQISKIAVSSQSGISFIDISDIIYAEASGNYSKLLMRDKKEIVLSRTLKDIQDVLEMRGFLRTHRQYIVNLNRVKHFNRVDSLLTMENDHVLPVARIQKDKLSEKFDWL